MKHGILVVLVLLIVTAPRLAAEPVPTQAADLYARALAQERTARDAASDASRAGMRRIVTSYEQIVRRFPRSGYSDNALWQAANLSMLIYERFGDADDRTRARKLFDLLAHEYPSSSLVSRAQAAIKDIDAAPATATPAAAPAPTASAATSRNAAAPPIKSAPAKSDPAPATTPAPPAPSSIVELREVHRTALPDGVRVTIDLDAEVSYHQEEVENPRRVFFDLKGVKAAPSLQDVTMKFDDDVVREIRLGRHPQNTTRVVLDLRGVEGYTVYPLYGPYRLVVDLKRAAATKATSAVPPPLVASLPAAPPPTESAPAPAVETRPDGAGPRDAAVPAVAKGDIARSEPKGDVKNDAAKTEPLPSKPAAPPTVAPPAANSNGKFSLSRQLGLGVSRIVIDAGHGGHDPGAHGNGINESELTLDVALRLQKLLQKQPGVDVVMTRDTDVFIPLQERTAIANREGADLFLSIHANASRNASARGIETYFLNFATNSEAEAVAARENAGSGQAMHDLPDIVKAIALNNKINESRDFADTVQKSMVRRLRTRNKALRDLGVKQAPFVVLIGASMPSVLAEISFVTHKQEGALLKSGAYRQSIAQALFDAIVSYQQALKKMTTVAGKKATY